jgi:hypothetical protein
VEDGQGGWEWVQEEDLKCGGWAGWVGVGSRGGLEVWSVALTPTASVVSSP